MDDRRERRPYFCLVIDVSADERRMSAELLDEMLQDPRPCAEVLVGIINEERELNGGPGFDYSLVGACYTFADDAENCAWQISGKAFVNYIQALYRAEHAKVELLEAEVAMLREEAERVPSHSDSRAGSDG